MCAVYKSTPYVSMHKDPEYFDVYFNEDGTITGEENYDEEEDDISSPWEMLYSHAWILWATWGILGFF
jgi:hypothetical protein